MPKFFIQPERIKRDTICLTGDTAHHMQHVLRVRTGEHIILCDGCGMDYHCVVTDVLNKEKTLLTHIKKILPCQTEPDIRVTLYQSMLKGEKFEWVIQKCIEAGVTEIIPVITERTVVRMKDGFDKTERFRRIAEAAAGQSMRGIIPYVHNPVYFKDALSSVKSNERHWVAYENESQVTLKQTVSLEQPASAAIWIGPEGGFADDEIFELRERGAVTVTLGKRILRAETAGMAAIFQLMCIMEAESTTGQTKN